MTGATNVDADAIATELLPRLGGAGFNKAAQDSIRKSILTNKIGGGAYLDEKSGCDAVGTGSLKATGLIGQGLATGAKFDPEPISKTILAIGAFVSSIVGKLLGHHKKAAALERGTLCALVPQFNDIFASNDADFDSGKLTRAQALQNLDASYKNWQVAVKPIFQSSQSKCNAACVIDRDIRGMIEYRQKVRYTGIHLPAWAKYSIGGVVLLLAGVKFAKVIL